MGVARSQRRRSSSQPRAKRINGASKALNSSKPIKFTLSSDPKLHQAVREAEEQILAAVAQCGYDDQSTFAIRISLEEALVNAIKHGNKLDPSKKVWVEAKISPKRAQIEIEDQGPGFDRTSVPDPTAEENLCKCSGRGILLMETYMNSVSWTKQGRRVKMVRVNQRHFPG